MSDNPWSPPRVLSSSALPRFARVDSNGGPASLQRSRSATTLATSQVVAHPLDVRLSSHNHEETAGTATNGITSVRSRKANGATEAGEGDVTRPSLQRHEAGALIAGLGTLSVQSKSKARTSLDGLSREQGNATEDREVVVHQVSSQSLIIFAVLKLTLFSRTLSQLLKTDTIASVSLKYGITPHALRLSNRLWPTDSIHLRRNLNIPLDQCHLPSSSSIERVSREEDGNLIVWEREPSTERRATHSSYEGSSGDLIGGFGEGTSRSSLDSFREASNRPTRLDGYKGKGKGPALLIDGDELEELDDAVSDYLPSTNNPYSFSAPPSPPFATNSSFNSEFNFTHSPTNSLGVNSDKPDPGPSSSTDSVDSYSRTWNSLASSSASPSGNPPKPSTASLSRRTLTVERIPASSLSFFPPPTPSFSNTSSTRSSFEIAPPVDEEALRAMFSKRHIANTANSAKVKGKSSPARKNLSAINPTWNSFVSPPSIGKSNGTRSPQETHELETPKKSSNSWMGMWDPLDFGGAEEASAESVLHSSRGAAYSSGIESAERRLSSAGTIRGKTRPPREVVQGELF